MNLQTYTQLVENQRMSDEELAIIRREATEWTKNLHSRSAGELLLRMLNHMNIIEADYREEIKFLTLENDFMMQRLKLEKEQFK